jgi:hypothetical protein
MSINVEALIRCLGKGYQEIFDAGFIPYKTKPTSSSGDPDLSLNMPKEGVYLSFKRDGRILQAVEVDIQNDKIKGWEFPNDLPAPLKKSMSRQWIHEHLGVPERSAPPEVFMKKAFGWTELYAIEGFHMPISMQVSYDLIEMAKSLTFLPTDEVRW